mmetsp:Transcript_54548/g.115887  ORF Transcript_54548/g.115887 Transcript_54548/m.115887 type:complete len:253 (+) Transcript_54548:224-982(+)
MVFSCSCSSSRRGVLPACPADENDDDDACPSSSAASTSGNCLTSPSTLRRRASSASTSPRSTFRRYSSSTFIRTFMARMLDCSESTWLSSSVGPLVKAGFDDCRWCFCSPDSSFLLFLPVFRLEASPLSLPKASADAVAADCAADLEGWVLKTFSTAMRSGSYVSSSKSTLTNTAPPPPASGAASVSYTVSGSSSSTSISSEALLVDDDDIDDGFLSPLSVVLEEFMRTNSGLSPSSSSPPPPSFWLPLPLQ